MQTFMNQGWGSHALLGRIAFESLPPRDQARFKLDLSPAAMDKPYFPARVRTAADKTGFMCIILDLVYQDDCRPFATMPDGRWIPHGPPDEAGQAATGSGARIAPDRAVGITEWLMGMMVDAIRRDDWETAIRHGGALGHYLQEPFTPGHSVDNTLFHELFPDPDPSRHIRLHHAFDSASDLFEPTAPVLMGRDVTEAAFRLQIEIDHGVRAGKALIAPVIRSVYEGRPASHRQELLADQCRKAAFVTASAWHTAIAIADSRFDPAEAANLDTLPLTRLPPYFWHACQYVDLLPGCLVERGIKIPIHVWEADGRGGKRETRPADGFGMGGHSGIKFFVGHDVMARFRCRVGLPSRHTEGQDAFTRTRFRVETDTTVNRIYSEEILYQATPRFECELKPGAPVQEVDIDLRGAQSLILSARCEPHTDPKTGQSVFSIPHVAVCDPVLLRR